MVTPVFLFTPAVTTLNTAELLPDGTVMLAGTVALLGFELASTTTTPPLGAGPLSDTVPAELRPPVTVAGLSVNDNNLTDGVG